MLNAPTISLKKSVTRPLDAVGKFVLEVEDCLEDKAEIASVCGKSREIAGVLHARNVKHVQAIMAAANRASGAVNIHPFSQGRNWGFGSKLPFANGAYLLDLSKLSGIRSEGIESHSVELECGVTQGDLDFWLGERGRSHFFNVTGAGLGASVIGNALERGIGYSGSRHHDFLDLEVVLPNGDLVRTCKHEAFQRYAYDSGLGPDVTGLFSQGSLGVVTAARVRLHRRPERMGGMICRFSNSQLPEVVKQLGEMISEGIGYGVPHIFNRMRILTSFGPHLDSEARSNLEKTASEWTALLPVKGAQAIFDATVLVMGKRLGKFGEIEILSDALTTPGARLNSLLEGRPTDFPLASVRYAVFGSSAPDRVLPMDDSDAGLIHITPMLSLEGTSVQRALTICDKILQIQGIGPTPLSINAVSCSAAVLVISLGFDRSNPTQTVKAQSTSAMLTSAFASAGMLPYRLHLGQAEHLPKIHQATRGLLRKIHRAFDPVGCMAPSKYSQLWEE